MIDLHTHTTASDGELEPTQLVEMAIGKGLKAVAITDHDTVSGVPEALKSAKNQDIEVVAGVEFKCFETESKFDEIDVLGLLIDYENSAIIKLIKKAEKSRIEQKKEIVEKLNKLGYSISFDELRKMAKGSIGRPHIARLLINKYPSKFSSIRQVFEELLGEGKPAHIERKYKITISEAIEAIHESKGAAFLAHPGIYDQEKAKKLITNFKKSGGDGIETIYPYHILCKSRVLGDNQKYIEGFQKIAKSLKLIETGGSDFHGFDRNTMNSVNVPDEILATIKKKIGFS